MERVKVKPEEFLVWMDLEMTGLEPDEDVILEIATIITDGQLNTVAEGPNIVIHHSDKVLNHMNDWCKKYHGDSGLTEQVRNSTVSLAQAEQQTLDFIRKHVRRRCPIVWQLHSSRPSIFSKIHAPP